MKNIEQINTILKALMKKRDMFLLELAKINKVIDKKNDSIKKMMTYLDDYHNEAQYSLSRSVPILNKNFDYFKGKINHILFAEEAELDKLNNIKSNKINEINEIDKKIQLMDNFKSVHEKDKAQEQEQYEQHLLDEMASNQYTRTYYD